MLAGPPAVNAAPLEAMRWWAGGGRITWVTRGCGTSVVWGAGLYGGGGPHYGTRVGESAAAAAAGGVHGFPAVLTSFIGRGGSAREVAGLLGEYRLVTVTGPGGAGKTRLATVVARAVSGRFADGTWLAEL